MTPAEMDSDKAELEVVEAAAAADPDECTASGDPKACADCLTTKTPLWRGGPTGPKSLCNACGIRYRKRRRVAMGLDPEVKRKPKKDAAQENDDGKASSTTKKAAAQENDDGKASSTTKTQTVELHMVGFAKDAVLKQRRRMRMRRRKPSCLGEEERAAILLMALSSGVIYA
ncbi:unnamed protein product [Alopecurus aequalis]